MILTEYSIKNNINNLKVNKANRQNLNRVSYPDDRFVLSFNGYQEALVYAKKSKFKKHFESLYSLQMLEFITRFALVCSIFSTIFSM